MMLTFLSIHKDIIPDVFEDSVKWFINKFF